MREGSILAWLTLSPCFEYRLHCPFRKTADNNTVTGVTAGNTAD